MRSGEESAARSGSHGGCVEEAGGCRTGRGSCPNEPWPDADRPFIMEHGFSARDCHYLGTNLEPTFVVIAPVGLGLNPLAVHSAFLELLRAEPQLDLQFMAQLSPYSSVARPFSALFRGKTWPLRLGRNVTFCRIGCRGH